MPLPSSSSDSDDDQVKSGSKEVSTQNLEATFKNVPQSTQVMPPSKSPESSDTEVVDDRMKKIFTSPQVGSQPTQKVTRRAAPENDSNSESEVNVTKEKVNGANIDSCSDKTKSTISSKLSKRQIGAKKVKSSTKESEIDEAEEFEKSVVEPVSITQKSVFNSDTSDSDDEVPKKAKRRTSSGSSCSVRLSRLPKSLTKRPTTISEVMKRKMKATKKKESSSSEDSTSDSDDEKSKKKPEKKSDEKSKKAVSEKSKPLDLPDLEPVPPYEEPKKLSSSSESTSDSDSKTINSSKLGSLKSKISAKKVAKPTKVPAKSKTTLPTSSSDSDTDSDEVEPPKVSKTKSSVPKSGPKLANKSKLPSSSESSSDSNSNISKISLTLPVKKNSVKRPLQKPRKSILKNSGSGTDSVTSGKSKTVFSKRFFKADTPVKKTTPLARKRLNLSQKVTIPSDSSSDEDFNKGEKLPKKVPVKKVQKPPQPSSSDSVSKKKVIGSKSKIGAKKRKRDSSSETLNETSISLKTPVANSTVLPTR